MTRAAKVARAQRLRDEGLKLREIADVLDLSGATSAWKLLNAERVREDNRSRRHQKQASERRRVSENAFNCPSCGGPMGFWAPRGGSSRCSQCYRDEELARTAERGRQIESEWKSGRKIVEIADQHGWTVGHCGVEITRLRGKGFDLPYRYTKGKRAGHKFPEQVAA